MSCSEGIGSQQFPEFGEQTGGGRDREIVRKEQHLSVTDVEEDL